MIIKKIFVGMSCFAIAMSMVACSNSDSSTTTSSSSVSESTIDITNNDVVKNMLKNVENAESVVSTLDVKINTTMSSGDDSVEVPMSISGTNTKYGDTIYAEITSTEDLTSLGQSKMTSITKQYSTKNEDGTHTVYSNISDGEQDSGWIISDSDSGEYMMDSMKTFRDSADKATVSDLDDGTHKITIALSDMKSDDTEKLTMGMGTNGDYVIYVDKDYYPTKIAIENFDTSELNESLSSESDTGVNSVDMSFEFNITFDKWNSADKIEIPQDVIDSAVKKNSEK